MDQKLRVKIQGTITFYGGDDIVVDMTSSLQQVIDAFCTRNKAYATPKDVYPKPKNGHSKSKAKQTKFQEIITHPEVEGQYKCPICTVFSYTARWESAGVWLPRGILVCPNCGAACTM